MSSRCLQSNDFLQQHWVLNFLQEHGVDIPLLRAPLRAGKGNSWCHLPVHLETLVHALHLKRDAAAGSAVARTPRAVQDALSVCQGYDFTAMDDFEHARHASVEALAGLDRAQDAIRKFKPPAAKVDGGIAILGFAVRPPLAQVLLVQSGIGFRLA